MRGAISGRDGDGVSVVGTRYKFIVGTVHAVSPHACGVDAEAAVVVATGHIALWCEVVAAVNIGRRQATAGALHGIAFGEAGGSRAGNDGGIRHSCYINSDTAGNR